MTIEPRGRTPLGAVYRSPLGEFGAGVAAAAAGGTILASEISTTVSRVLRAGCDLGSFSGGTPGYTLKRFNYDNLSAPIESVDIVNYYHIGMTSGEVWRPADDGMSFNCQSAGFSPQTLTDFNPGGTPINIGGVLDIYPYHGEIFVWNSVVVPTETGVITTDLYVNTGEFPSSVVPAFIDFEEFTLSLAPP